MNQLVYKAGYKYVVHDRFYYDTGIVGHAVAMTHLTLDGHGTLCIEPGYAWDGASGPAIDTVNFRRGSLVHDALYQLIAEDALPFSCRKIADDILVKICKEDGMWFPRRWWVKAAVNIFGATALENRNPILFAPEKMNETTN